VQPPTDKGVDHGAELTPAAVSWYSTRGGTSAYTVRVAQVGEPPNAAEQVTHDRDGPFAVLAVTAARQTHRVGMI
jgi:hypothetical protein